MLAGPWGLRQSLLDPQLQPGRVVDARQPRQGEGAEQQAEVPQGDVVEARVGEQVDDDPGQPGGNAALIARGFELDSDAKEER